jgi:hypothetical protein
MRLHRRRAAPQSGGDSFGQARAVLIWIKFLAMPGASFDGDRWRGARGVDERCVVIVDEDAAFARRLAGELRECGRRVHVLPPHDELPAKILACHAGAVFLSAGLPGSSAMRVARTLRAVGYRGQLVCMDQARSPARAPSSVFDARWEKPFGETPLE